MFWGFYFFFKTKVLCIPEWPHTHYVVENDLELLILLPLPSETAGIIGMCHQVQFLTLLRTEPRTSYVLGKDSRRKFFHFIFL